MEGHPCGGYPRVPHLFCVPPDKGMTMKHIKTVVKVYKQRGSSWWNWVVTGSLGGVYAHGAKRTEKQALEAGRGGAGEPPGRAQAVCRRAGSTEPW